MVIFINIPDCLLKHRHAPMLVGAYIFATWAASMGGLDLATQNEDIDDSTGVDPGFCTRRGGYDFGKGAWVVN